MKVKKISGIIPLWTYTLGITMGGSVYPSLPVSKELSSSECESHDKLQERHRPKEESLWKSFPVIGIIVSMFERN